MTWLDSLIIGAIAVAAVYLCGRNSVEKDVLKKDIKTGEKVNDILQKQRDDHINSVDDADRMWESAKKD